MSYEYVREIDHPDPMIWRVAEDGTVEVNLVRWLNEGSEYASSFYRTKQDILDDSLDEGNAPVVPCNEKGESL